MPRRNARPITFSPRGLSDAVDGSDAFAGAMLQLANLVPSISTKGVFVPRPAAALETDFTGSGVTSPQVPSALLVVGSRIYGMVPSSNFPGRDQPFCYDTSVPGFITISGQATALLPATQSTSGDWSPPHMEMVADRIMVTHAGFSGGSNPYFGWIDLTGFSLTTLVGNITNGSKVIQSISGDGLSTPILDGVQPGQAITGAGIPANTTVVSVTNGTTDINTTGTTHSSTLIDSIPASAVSLMAPGMYVTGSGIVAGTYIQAIASGTSITLSQAATSGASGVAINVSGGGTITISNAATANTNLLALAITGGTFAAPVWGAGNTNVVPLPAVPLWVSNFNGRAWYAVNNAEYFSDSLLPLNITQATQALTFGDNTPVTASAGLPLNNITTGGIIQALIVFKGDEVMWQITGDQATNNLSTNTLNVSVGCVAPNTVVSTPKGLVFVAPDGLRLIDFQAHVSDPIGANGQGVSVPFINALYPSRMCAAFNQNVLRVTVQNGAAVGQPYQEYWFDFNLKIWTGPHSFPASLINAFQAPAGAVQGHGFISAAVGVNGKLWQSGVNPLSTDTYTENGVLLSWAFQTVLLPDNQEMSQNRMGQTTIAMALPGGQSIAVSFSDEVGNILNQVNISAPGSVPAVWGSFVWGGSLWGAATGYFRQYNIPWTAPIVFKQGTVSVVGSSQAGFAIGNLYLKYQPLGYLINVLGSAA